MRREHLKPARVGRGQQDLVIGDGGLVAPLVEEALHHLNIVAGVLGAGVVRSCRQLTHPSLEIVGIEVAVELRFEQALRLGSGVGEPLQGAVRSRRCRRQNGKGGQAYGHRESLRHVLLPLKKRWWRDGGGSYVSAGRGHALANPNLWREGILPTRPKGAPLPRRQARLPYPQGSKRASSLSDLPPRCRTGQRMRCPYGTFFSCIGP